MQTNCYLLVIKLHEHGIFVLGQRGVIHSVIHRIRLWLEVGPLKSVFPIHRSSHDLTTIAVHVTVQKSAVLVLELVIKDQRIEVPQSLIYLLND